MDTLMTIVISLGILTAGILIRAGVALLVLTLISIPLLAIAIGVHKLEELWQAISAVVLVGGLPWKQRLYYAPGHTWVKRGRRAVRVGLDGVANRILVGARALELPQPGSTVRVGEVVGYLTCGDKRAEIASPLSGIVTATNQALGPDPSALHRDPYGQGWLFDVVPADFRHTGLRRGRSARRWFSEEAAHLTHFLERDLGLATADGGELLLATPALLNNEQWTALTETFLQPKAPASTGGGEVAETDAPGRFAALSLALGGALIGVVYVIFFPIVGFASLIQMCALRLWQLVRSGAARVAKRRSRPAHL